MSFFSYLRRLRSQIQGDGAGRLNRRSAKRRDSKPGFEALEDRTLLAVNPLAIVDPNSQESLDGGSNATGYNSPTVARDPLNPNRLVVVSTTGSALMGNYSLNGGADWFSFGLTPGLLTDPNSPAATPFSYTQMTGPSVAFDRDGNFYVTYTQHDATRNSGALLLEKYSFQSDPGTGNLVPTPIDLDLLRNGDHKILNRWVADQAVLNPVVAVDTTQKIFADPDTGATQVSPYSNDLVYVAWGSTGLGTQMRMIASPDGGYTFTSEAVVTGGGSAPQILFTQGTADGRIDGGVMKILWNNGGSIGVDLGVDATGTPLPQRAAVAVASDSFPDAVHRDVALPFLAFPGAFNNGGGRATGDAIIPASGDHVAVETIYALDVDIADPNFDSLTDLDLHLALENPHLDQVRLILRAPDGTEVLLFRNRKNGADQDLPLNNPPPQGLGNLANLGVINNRVVGMVFDQDAPRTINAAPGPFVGHFQPEVFRGNQDSFDVFNGRTAAELNGTWFLRVIDFRNSNESPNKPAQLLHNWELRFTSGLSNSNFGDNSSVNSGGFPMANGQTLEVPAVAANQGIRSGASYAIDNTLGSFSPYQGRMYAVYTTINTFIINNVTLVTDTDIAMSTSDDGGDTWIYRGVINDDDPTGNGNSEIHRYQFQPQVTVDQMTGTVVVTWYDARNDASRTRVATYIATSIDGGESWSAQTYLNASRTSTDAITGEVLNIEPIPTNPGGTGASGYGEHQAVSAHGGRVNAFWVGNDNQTPDSVVDNRTTIRTASVHVPAGPRIVSSDMGPVVNASTYTDPTTGTITTYNGTLAMDDTNVSAGTRQLDGFLVTFDRPVDPNTFTPADVMIHYRDPYTAAGSPPTAIIVPTDIVPLNDGQLFGPNRVGDAANDPGVRVLATTFLVKFDPQGRVGTYSYAIGPDIQDRIRNFDGEPVVNSLTGPQAITSTDTPIAIPDRPVGQPPIPVTSTINVPANAFPAGQFVTDVNVTVNLDHTFDGHLILTLIAPDGRRFILANQRGGTGEDFTNTIFDDQASAPIASGAAPFTGTFRPEQPLASLLGADYAGDWILEIQDMVNTEMGTLLDWTLELTTGTVTIAEPTLTPTVPAQSFGSTGGPVAIPDATTVTSVINVPVNAFPAGNLVVDVNVTVNLSHTATGNLILTLISPTNQRIELANQRGGTGDNFIDTVFDNSAAMAIGAGMAPFTGTFRPDQSLFALYGSDFAGNWTLEISDQQADTQIGTLVDWTLELTTRTRFDSTDVPQPIPMAGTVASTIDIPAGTFPLGAVINDVNVNVDLTHTFSADLVVTLISPRGKRVVLTSLGGGFALPRTFDDDNPANAPDQPLASLIGEDYAGTWTLEISDIVGADQGTLNGWSLDLGTGTHDPIIPALVPNGPFVRLDAPDAQVNKPIGDLAGYPGSGIPAVTSVINVGAAFETVADVRVNLNIAHTQTNQVIITLTSPLGTVVTLYNGTGQAPFPDPSMPPPPPPLEVSEYGPLSDDNFVNTTFDDHVFPVIYPGPFHVTTGFAPFTGSYRPQPLDLDGLDNAMSRFAGEDPSGNWTLTIIDTASGESGRLLNWSLEILQSVPGPADGIIRGNYMDQDGDGRTKEVSGVVGATNTNPYPFNVIHDTSGDVYAVPNPVNGTPLRLPYTQDTLPLIVPGPHLAPAPIFTQNEVTGSQPNGLPVPTVGTGGSGVDADDTSESSLTVSGIPADRQIIDVDVNVVLHHELTGDLELTLIAPDGTEVVLARREANPGPDGIPGTGDDLGAGPDGVFGLIDPIFNEVDDGRGKNFANTNFDDQANVSIAATGNGADAPYIGSFRPRESLSVLNGKDPNGTWKLRIRDLAGGQTELIDGMGDFILDGNGDVQLVDTVGFLKSWSLTIDTTRVVLNGTTGSVDIVFDRDMDPTSFTVADIQRIVGPAGNISLNTVTVTANPPGTPVELANRTFRVNFPTQALGGTYTVVYGPNIQAARGANGVTGDQLDLNLNAGVYQLRGVDPNNLTTTNVVTANNNNFTIFGRSTIQSKITVTDPFQLRSLLVSLRVVNSSGLGSQDLVAKLFSPDGTEILLFNGPGSSNPSSGNPIFDNTVLDDLATTPIANGSGAFVGSFNPQTPLSSLIGEGSAGVWTLQIQNLGTGSGILDAWSLIQRKAIPGTGLGEAMGDQGTAHFRIFTMDPNNPLSEDVWTAVGPASLNSNGNAGRVTAVSVDPSDPSGNTVYIGAPSGGIWKTTNFLTTESTGPTWQALTDFGPTHGGLHISSITLIPVKNANGQFDPRLTMIFASTGEGQARQQVSTEGMDPARGVGVLRSLNGGLTWQLLDSTDNTLPFSGVGSRDHAFVGTTTYKIVADPTLNPVTGKVILYMAVSNHLNAGNMGGIWRSLDSGDHWERLNQFQGANNGLPAGNGSDIVLDPASRSQTTGLLQTIFVSLQGANGGVYMGDTQSNFFLRMDGTQGSNPVVKDGDNPPGTFPPITVLAPPSTPTGNNGRVILAKPPLTDNPVHNILYSGWLYAAVATAGGSLQGLYVTKDLGANWTRIRLSQAYDRNGNDLGIQSNNETGALATDFDPLFDGNQGIGNLAMTLAVDPTNPNVVYLGGATLIRIDTAGLNDAQNLTAYDHSDADGATIERNGVGSVTVKPPLAQPPLQNSGTYGLAYSFTNRRVDFNPYVGSVSRPYFNLIKNPTDIFATDATLYVRNVVQFNNNGTDAHWTPFNLIRRPDPFNGSTPITTALTQMITIVDPMTGGTRLIFGDAQGIYTGVDDGTGQLITGIGSATTVNGSRSGNLQIAQFFQGAAQPSQVAAELAQALFYGTSQDNGAHQQSTGDVLDTGYLGWTTPFGNIGSTGDPYGNAAGVATDPTGTGTQYHFVWPEDLADTARFFQVTRPGSNPFVAIGSGLNSLLVPNAAQWLAQAGRRGLQFGVNPINGEQIVMGSHQGRVYRTRGGFQFWQLIANPAQLDGSYAQATAYGAPDPLSPSLNNDDFIYAGTVNGGVFVTLNGGLWVNLDPTGILDGTEVIEIVANPTRGSHEAYVTTQGGVYHVQFGVTYNVGGGYTVNNVVWTNLTGNLFNLQHTIFGDATQVENILAPNSLTALAVDWRFQIADDPNNPSSPVHPILYVAGIGGVFRAKQINRATGTVTWTFFPNVTDDAAPVDGGYLPVAHVTDLDLSLGNIDPTTGKPIQGGGAGLLVATTFGRGTFAIRLDDSGLVISGPRVVGVSPTSPVDTGFSFIEVTFDGPVDPNSFTATDVQLNGPNGAVTINGIQDVTPAPVPGNLTPGSVFRITFDPQTTGTYSVVIGPNITDFGGRPMNQNENTVNGEAGDEFTTSWNVIGFGVEGINPSGVITPSTPLQVIDVTFSLGVDAATIIQADDFTVTGPGGVIPLVGLPQVLDPGTNRVWRITLNAPQTAEGTYFVQVGPNIQSLAAVSLGGVFTGTITIQAEPPVPPVPPPPPPPPVVTGNDALSLVTFLSGPMKRSRNGLYTQRFTLYNNSNRTVAGPFSIVLANLTKGARMVQPDGYVTMSRKVRGRSRRAPFRVTLLSSGQIAAFSGQDVVVQIRYRGPGRPRFNRIVVAGLPPAVL